MGQVLRGKARLHVWSRQRLRGGLANASRDRFRQSFGPSVPSHMHFTFVACRRMRTPVRTACAHRASARPNRSARWSRPWRRGLSTCSSAWLRRSPSRTSPRWVYAATASLPRHWGRRSTPCPRKVAQPGRSRRRDRARPGSRHAARRRRARTACLRRARKAWSILSRRPPLSG
jgi:hypothetical protein